MVGLASLASVVGGESLGGGAVVGTSVTGTKTGTSVDCAVNTVGELEARNGEDGIAAKFDQKHADEYVLYDSSGRRRKLGIYDISRVLSDR